MLSDIFCIVMLIVFLSIPIFYQNDWKYKVLNKHQDFFVVSEIEKRTLTFRKAIFLYIGLFFILIWWEKIICLCEQLLGLDSENAEAYVATADQGNWLTVIGLTAVGLVVVMLWFLFARFCYRIHTSLPLRKYLNEEEMIRSIESEKFELIAEFLWHSSNWIRISNLFFPKSAIINIRADFYHGGGGHHTVAGIVVDTVWEKEFRSNDFSRYDKELQAKVERLMGTLEWGTAKFKREERSILGDMSRFKSRTLIESYMQSHSATEFINNRAVTDAMIAVCCAPEKIASYVLNEPCTLDAVGMSGSTVLTYDKWVLKIEPATEWALRTVEMMKWLKGKLPVPKVICHEVMDGRSYLFMSRIKGKMSCDEYYLERPQKLLRLLAESLKMFWRVDIRNCPHIRDLDAELAEARERVEQGLVDVENAEPDTFGPDGFANPEELLKWLEENRPKQEPVFSHGDFCLPNVFLQDGEIAGFIDLGDAGVGDKWRDIALCYRSLKHNFDGTYGGKVYEDFNPDMLFEALGIEAEWDKLRYYILLDELF